MNRTVIPDPRNLYSQMEKAVLDDRAKENMVISGISVGLFAATFTLSALQIGQLKKQVQKKAAEQGMPFSHCSSFVVCCAYSWICLLKACCITDGDGKAHIVFAVDWRPRIRPAIPASYIGNCLGRCFAKCDAEELLSKDGIFVACAALEMGIEELGDDANESLNGVMDKLGEVAPWQPLSLAGRRRWVFTRRISDGES